ncbi:hypothetical protein SAMD00019534_091150 [Acytostelium subglobosum LB1]|uniref:hypothetical protein n=1 Tax=Acytostelium subglobosum LB1 TaxID=1410327 RepID=UPI0006451920|nr:hypothetical protein SAMD00019534_091150 [Acytostelium subglobosum LB1]GAM25940.1 hypothetical protein SAMD00019534_091150 [Acytostelium subglobosum LB1]|eukprot:XP_012750983.1 hypothetical protein SAMD00019534_091150 [Acytostelium subglobosum LB1]
MAYGRGGKRGGGGGGAAAGGKLNKRAIERSKANHKGQERHVLYGNEEGVEDIRRRNGDSSDEEVDDSGSEHSSGEEVDESSEDEKPVASAPKVDASNPNRVKTVTKKVSDLPVGHKVELSRREKEEVAKQQAQIRAQEKQQKADMERLLVIRKQREEAAKKREEEKKAMEEKAAEKRRTGL